MQIKFEKGSEEWQLFSDYYEFRQIWYYPDNNEKWFEDAVNAGDALIKKYESTHLNIYAQKLVMAHLEDVEIRWRKNKCQENVGRKRKCNT